MRGTTLIPHVDDLACAHGANAAFAPLVDAGVVTSGSVIVPAGWFPELAALASERPDLDIGVHLALTSESAGFRWKPIVSSDPGFGLVDASGHFWADPPSVRRNADTGAVHDELVAQIETALAAGVDVTHLDHHMGVALAPEFAEITTGLAEQYQLPILFPADIAGYVAALELGPVDLEAMVSVGREARESGWAFGDQFFMGLSHQDLDCATVFEQAFSEPAAGTTLISLHCSDPGDIEAVHPDDAAWRIAENGLFRDPAFGRWVAEREIELSGLREIRDLQRKRP